MCDVWFGIVIVWIYGIVVIGSSFLCYLLVKYFVEMISWVWCDDSTGVGVGVCVYTLA